jgi:hypothetical protein
MRRQKIVVTKKIKSGPVVKHISRLKKKRVEAAKLLVVGNDKLPAYTAKEKRTKIALIQTGCWGDNINSTLMFGPLRQRYPDCVIDVYTSTYYANAFYNNPYIDNIIKYVSTDKQTSLHLTVTIPDAIKHRGYDKIFAPHPMPIEG